MKKSRKKTDEFLFDSDDEPKISREHSQIRLWLPYNFRSGLHTYLNGGITLF